MCIGNYHVYFKYLGLASDFSVFMLELSFLYRPAQLKWTVSVCLCSVPEYVCLRVETMTNVYPIAHLSSHPSDLNQIKLGIFPSIKSDFSSNSKKFHKPQIKLSRVKIFLKSRGGRRE